MRSSESASGAVPPAAAAPYFGMISALGMMSSLTWSLFVLLKASTMRGMKFEPSARTQMLAVSADAACRPPPMTAAAKASLANMVFTLLLLMVLLPVLATPPGLFGRAALLLHCGGLPHD